MKLIKIPFDKKLHFGFGAFFGLTAYLLSAYYGASEDYRMFIGSIVTVIVSVGTEVYQKITKTGKFEKLDILYTIFGGFSSCIGFYGFTLLVDYIKTFI